MTSNASRLEVRTTEDGSFSLFSPEVGEGFHSGRGALAEARSKFVAPAELERWPRERELRVLDVCMGTGSNSAALLETCAELGLRLQWWGLELDPEPLRLALADGGFRSQWSAQALKELEQLSGSERMLWGDARQRLPELLNQERGRLDLVLMDAFSPSRCPQLWSLEFLSGLGQLLAPDGLLLTYCSAAAVRKALRLSGLQIASIEAPNGLQAHQNDWSGGTAASPGSLAERAHLRWLSPMEEEHLLTNAAEPYRDPDGQGERNWILQERQRAQRQAMLSGAVEGTSSWRRRWGIGSSRAKPAENHQ